MKSVACDFIHLQSFTGEDEYENVYWCLKRCTESGSKATVPCTKGLQAIVATCREKEH